MKKLTCVFLSLIMLTVMLSGCSNTLKTNKSSQTSSTAVTDSRQSTTADQKESKKTITITRRLAEWGARDANFHEALKRLNKELEPQNVEVTVEEWPKVDDDQLLLQGQAGKKADIFMNSSVDIGWELDAGLIRDIDWVKDAALFKNTSENLMNIMYYKGHYYGLIQDMDTSPVFLSRPALKKLGMSDNDIDGLRDKVINGEFVLNDLVDLAKKALDQGLVDTGFAVEDKRFEGWGYAFGITNYDLDQNKLVFDENAVKDLYSFWADASKKGVISESIGDLNTDLSAPKFIEGSIFASFARTEYYSKLRAAKGMENDPDGFDQWFNENVICIPIPGSKKGGHPVSYSNPAMIFVGADVDDEKMPYVQRLIELMMSPDLQVEHTLLSGKLPVTPDAFDDTRIKDLKYYNEQLYMMDFTSVRSPHPYYARFIEGYLTGVDTILVSKKDANAAYEAYLADTKQNIPDNEIIYK
ncbi:ABC transporter substrate-binding protein [Anaerocolumna sp. MB42-C2]|uniref:ABC transporter substrate-binding protein n=1 Tax=Anaerocolumna sp. MB42-C2 TaxID=3070997 RepID=UPI0027E09FBA|nr:ABC transporter substrate-binding protein [Anaerocolumna sp. MB42-C2]WMJ90270.1 ABC transporter substrate-binding protein [Anaerocolumna sp. MB42-C2]